MESLDHPEESQPSERGDEAQIPRLREELRRPEELIAERYRVVGVLGRGGVATTYQAEDLQTGKQVALKELSLRQMSDWKVLELFERESRVLANLDHPNIPKYLGHFQVDTPQDRSFYLVQELADGHSLAELVREGWHAGEREVRELAIQVLNILTYLHQLTPPVIHRDIKPQNIIRRPDGRIALVDFGSVQDTYRNTLTQGSTVVGTYGYMAPEQFRGKAATASDLYGIGATLLFLLTHRSPADLPQRKLRIDFRAQVRVSQAFADWLEKMLEPVAEDRYPSARAALGALKGEIVPGERVWPRFSDLWRWDGTVDRGPYVILGLSLFALKYNLDRLVATLVFHHDWSLFSYWTPTLGRQFGQFSESELTFSATMVCMALPFIWVGVILTLRRLRAVQLPSWLVVLFFVPILNLFFFTLLSVLPSRQPEDRKADELVGHVKAILDLVIPDSAIGSAAMAILLLMPFGAGAAVLSVSALTSYGWGLFVGLPFALGFGSVLLYGYHHSRSYLSCLLVSCISVLLLGLILIAIAVEGMLCVAMAAPIGLALAAIGGTLGYLIQRGGPGTADFYLQGLVPLLVVPALMGAESISPPAPPLFAVRTAVDVDAPPERVWQQVIAFTDLPPPREWIFHTGVAYPIRARIYGHGAGAIRHCVFSTGAFVEPIQVWDEPRLLKFLVRAQPPAMREWTPYSNIHPPHLDDFLRSRAGQFLLTPLPGGRTRLEGTTWYHHQIWPAHYWRIWSDLIIHSIHRRVLNHVKHLAES